MLKKLLASSVAVVAAFSFYVGDAKANSSAPLTQVAVDVNLNNPCRWDPQGSSICRGRNFCAVSVYHPKCQRYCSYYPYDRVCRRW